MRLPALLPPLEPDQVDAFRAEVAEQNRRRLMVLAPLMLVVHAVHLWLFSTSAEQRATLAPSVVHWRDAVWGVHAVTEVAVVGFVAFLWLAGRTRAGRRAGAMAAVLWLLHAAATAGADQLNVPTVAPYMAYAVVVGVFVLLTPLEAVTVLGVGLAALTAALFEMQPSHMVRTEQLLNGPSVTLPALLLSGFLYAARRRDFVQRATIDRQQQALATLNAELEQRVRDQVAEITQRAAEVEVLNVRLRAQVRAQADQLATALASSDPTGGHAMDRLVEGRVLSGRFEVGGRLGAGGMGEVHAGIDRETGERVAIKVVNPAAWPQPEDLQRFLREVRTAASVSHPAVVRMLHVDVSDTGLLFQVQELVEGTSLETCTAAERAFEPGPVARVGAALCEALAAAHAQGVIHRDVKPANVMLTPSPPGLKLLDFGISKLRQGIADETQVTQTGKVLGTPAFMGPEVLGAEPGLSESGDVYAVGVTLFMLLAGRHPFEDTSLLGLFAGHLAGPPPDVRSVRADVPAELAEVVAACLRTEPTRRPLAAEVAATLTAWADAHRVPSLDRLLQRGTFSEPGAA